MEDLKLEPINVDVLKSEKGFQKTAKKQQKEIDILKKKQMKEKGLVEKNQCSAVEKVVKGREWVVFCQILLLFAAHH